MIDPVTKRHPPTSSSSAASSERTTSSSSSTSSRSRRRPTDGASRVKVRRSRAAARRSTSRARASAWSTRSIAGLLDRYAIEYQSLQVDPAGRLPGRRRGSRPRAARRRRRGRRGHARRQELRGQALHVLRRVALGRHVDRARGASPRSSTSSTPSARSSRCTTRRQDALRAQPRGPGRPLHRGAGRGGREHQLRRGDRPDPPRVEVSDRRHRDKPVRPIWLTAL